MQAMRCFLVAGERARAGAPPKSSMSSLPLRLSARAAALQQRLSATPSAAATVANIPKELLPAQGAIPVQQRSRGAHCRDRQLSDDSAAMQALKACLGRRDAIGALTAWELLRAENVWLTGSSLKRLLAVCAKTGAWERARGVLEATEAPPPAGRGLQADVGLWNIVLTGCVRMGQLRDAEALLDTMTGESSTDGRCIANVDSFNALLRGYLPSWAGGEGTEARVRRSEVLLARMSNMGIQRDASTYAALVGLHWLDAERVAQLLAEAATSGVRLQVLTYARASRALWWARKRDDAWKMLATMREAGVEPDVEFYLLTIAAAESVGCFDDADRLHREALKNGLGSALAAKITMQASPRHAASLHARGRHGDAL